MAKIPYTKLDCKVDMSTCEIDINGQQISIKNYLPIQEKLEMISDIINGASATETSGYWNPGKINVFFTLEIMYRYTNINFTDKQKADPVKLYDQIVSSGLYNKVINIIEASELNFINSTLNETLRNIYNYRNSIYGILDVISTDYKDLELDAQAIADKLGNTEDLAFLKDVMTKMA